MIGIGVSTFDTRVPVEKVLPEHLELPDPSRFLRRLDGREHKRPDGQEQHVEADEHQQAYGGRRPHGDRAARAVATAVRRTARSAGVSSSQFGRRPVTDWLPGGGGRGVAPWGRRRRWHPFGKPDARFNRRPRPPARPPTINRPSPVGRRVSPCPPSPTPPSAHRLSHTPSLTIARNTQKTDNAPVRCGANEKPLEPLHRWFPGISCTRNRFSNIL